MNIHHKGKEYRVDVHDIYGTLDNRMNRCIICGERIRSKSKDAHFRWRHTAESPRYGVFVKDLGDEQKIKVKPLSQVGVSDMRKWYERNFGNKIEWRD